MNTPKLYCRVVSKLAIFLSVLCTISACNPNSNTNSHGHSVTFTPVYNETKINCHTKFKHQENDWQYQQLLFFVSSIEIKDDNEQWHKAKLKVSQYQTQSLALIGERCGDQENWQLNFDDQVDINNAEEIRFTLGLPFEVNHLNPLTQPSPLNVPSMFCGWQKGHKFLRLEIKNDVDNWLFHLGSVGCKAASPLRAPQQECLFPNRFTYTLPLDNSNKDKITKKLNIKISLDRLLKDLILNNSLSCQSAPENNQCKSLNKHLSNKNKQMVFNFSSDF